jgi:hypothetical protein
MKREKFLCFFIAYALRIFAPMLEQLIQTILTYLNASSYYKSAEEIQNAINNAQILLYEELRGNMAEYRPGAPVPNIVPQSTNVSSEALAELYRVYQFDGPGPLSVVTEDDRVVDVILSVEIRETITSLYYPVNIVPDNQYLKLLRNPVVPPTFEHPYGRTSGLNSGSPSFDIAPEGYNRAQVRCLTLPTNVEFTFTESGGALPDITIAVDTDYTPEKLSPLLSRTIAQLGFNLSNGVLVQAGNQQSNASL